MRPGRRLMLLGGRGNPALAAAIAAELGVGLGAVKLKTFSNSEVYCRIEESIRGADVFIVQPTCANPELGMSANDTLMELLVMIDAAVGASAHRIVAVVPWFGYSRQDKKSAPREPISTRLVARALESAGADRVLTMDLHAGQVQGFFHVPVDHMTAMMLLVEQVRGEGRPGASPKDELVVVAPDAGRVKLNRNFAKRLGAGLALLDKDRPEQQVAEIGAVIGEVEGKTAIIVDDMIDTAGTLCAAGEAVMAAGAKEVCAVATHAIFSGGAYETLAASPFRRIVVTDTVPIRPAAPDCVEVVSCARLLADTVGRIFTEDSVSEVFDGQNQVF
ncbi:MAG: ribose-phosphate pyrophosphokinase [Actinobacteria bacterium]|nr:ribose-phosphate pyrophosphokinase [Actinomycetota bacterium]